LGRAGKKTTTKREEENNQVSISPKKHLQSGKGEKTRVISKKGNRVTRSNDSMGGNHCCVIKGWGIAGRKNEK